MGKTRQTAIERGGGVSDGDWICDPCLERSSGPVSCAGVVYVSGCVYAVGGFNGSLRVRTVDCYDPMMDRWTSVSSMQDRRSTLGAAVLNGLLYAVGGFDGSTGGCGPSAGVRDGGR